MFSLELRNRFWRDFPPHFLLMPLDIALLSPADLPKPIIPGAQASEKKIGFRVQMLYVSDSRRFLPYALATKQRDWAHFMSCHVLLLCVRSWKSCSEVCLSQVWHVDLMKNFTPTLSCPSCSSVSNNPCASPQRNRMGRKTGRSCVPTSSRDLLAWKHLSCTLETENIPAILPLLEDKITNDPTHLLRATTDMWRDPQDHVQASAAGHRRSKPPGPPGHCCLLCAVPAARSLAMPSKRHPAASLPCVLPQHLKGVKVQQ